METNTDDEVNTLFQFDNENYLIAIFHYFY